jgi:hypothetical protein
MSFTVDGTSGLTFPNSTTQAVAYNGVNYILYTSGTNTWNVPTGITSALITIIGGGGGGNGSFQGGSAGFAIVFLTGLSGSYTVTVGAGGAGNTGTSIASNGSTSSFGSFISCTGGNGATGSANGISGSATISSGTNLKSGNLDNNPYNISLFFGGRSTTPGNTAINYIASASPGPGIGGDSPTNKGGVGGVILIQY